MAINIIEARDQLMSYANAKIIADATPQEEINTVLVQDSFYTDFLYERSTEDLPVLDEVITLFKASIAFRE